MAQLPEIIPVRDLRQETAAVLKRLQSSGQPFVVTQRGRTAAVLLSADAYERCERERHLLRFLVRGEQEITAGSVTTWMTYWLTRTRFPRRKR